jgi:predicted DNA-binding transcriptional regulator YafY
MGERATRRGDERHNRAVYARLFWALGKVREGVLSTRSLASRFGVSLRTAYRDVDFLRDSWRVEMDYDATRRGFVLTGDVPHLPPARLSHGEMAALLFAERLARQYRGTPFETQVHDAFRKIESLLPAEVEVEGDHLDALVSIDLGPVYVGDPETFSTVLKAAMERRVLRARYNSLSANATRVREIHPYKVFSLKGDWYVAAFDPGHKEVRDFAIHRLSQPKPLKKRFERDPAFDFDAYKARAFGIEKATGAIPAHVTLRFSPRQSRWIRERVWHKTARFEEHKNGAVILHMDVPESSELVRWILQFGPDVEVLGPESLRATTGAHLRKAAMAYGHLLGTVPGVRLHEREAHFNAR